MKIATLVIVTTIFLLLQQVKSVKDIYDILLPPITRHFMRYSLSDTDAQSAAREPFDFRRQSMTIRNGEGLSINILAHMEHVFESLKTAEVPIRAFLWRSNADQDPGIVEQEIIDRLQSMESAASFFLAEQVDDSEFEIVGELQCNGDVDDMNISMENSTEMHLNICRRSMISALVSPSVGLRQNRIRIKNLKLILWVQYGHDRRDIVFFPQWQAVYMDGARTVAFPAFASGIEGLMSQQNENTLESHHDSSSPAANDETCDEHDKCVLTYSTTISAGRTASSGPNRRSFRRYHRSSPHFNVPSF